MVHAEAQRRGGLGREMDAPRRSRCPKVTKGYDVIAVLEADLTVTLLSVHSNAKLMEKRP
jgi:hypothetical protein